MNEPTYDLSIHSNPDASAWAKLFCEKFPPGSPVPDEGTMLGWFANAMMAMHDHNQNAIASVLAEPVSELLRVLPALPAHINKLED